MGPGLRLPSSSSASAFASGGMGLRLPSSGSEGAGYRRTSSGDVQAADLGARLASSSSSKASKRPPSS
eukprot:2003077-Rhodomonas_salina.1